MQQCLLEAEFQRVLAEEEATGQYPRRSFDQLRAAGFAQILGDHAGEPALFTAHHVFGLNASIASLSGSLGITVGVTMLGLLPIQLGGTESQRARFCHQARSAGVALLLTEWEHGSDLKANKSYANTGTMRGSEFVPTSSDFTHYRVSGAKHLINAAAHSELLVTLVRTRQQTSTASEAGVLGAAADQSVLVISPGEGVRQLPRYPTLPMQGAVIGGVEFEGAVVPLDRRLGEDGEGFTLIQRSLTISRGGIGALASGTSGRALELARSYAHTRELYGAPIVTLDPIVEHLVRADALHLALTCMSVKAACLVNTLGTAAAHHTAIAKYACCELAEQVVDEGRRVVSSRALVAGEYDRVVRDVLLYSVFDGTRHVMLQQIQARLRQLAARSGRGAGAGTANELALLRRIYHAAPVRIAEIGRKRELPYVDDPVVHARALSELDGDVDVEPLIALAEGLCSVASTLLDRQLWQQDLALGFGCARVLAYLETAFAVAELGDPARRRALELPIYGEPAAAARARYAVGLVAGMAASELTALAASQALGEQDALRRAESALWAMTGSARAALKQALRNKTEFDDNRAATNT